jgi:hypothetical protein
VATSHDAALPGHPPQGWKWFFSIVVRLRNPDHNIIWVWKAQRARGGAVGREVQLYFELTPSAIRRDGDDVVVYFRVAGVWTVQEWLYNMTDTKILEFSMDSQFRLNWIQSTNSLSRHGVHLSMQGCTLVRMNFSDLGFCHAITQHTRLLCNLQLDKKV